MRSIRCDRCNADISGKITIEFKRDNFPEVGGSYEVCDSCKMAIIHFMKNPPPKMTIGKNHD